MGATICGNCSNLHPGIAEVKACYAATEKEKRDQARARTKVSTRGRSSNTERGAYFPEQVTDQDDNRNWRDLKAGVYVHNGETFQVKISNRSGLPYASKQVRHGKGSGAKVTFDYEPGAIRKLRPTDFVSDIDKMHNAKPEPEAGMYRDKKRGDVLKVYRAVHGSGNMVCKRMHVTKEPVRDEGGKIIEAAVISWEYLGLATRFLAKHKLVTLDEAKEWGELYGCCMRCGKVLTLEASIEAALGTTCIKYFRNADAA